MSRIRSRIKSYLSAALRHFGYRLAPIKDLAPVDVRTVCNHPGALHYHSAHRPVLVDLDIHLGRGFRTLPLTDKTHPFVHALTVALNSNDRKAVIQQELEHYYANVQPLTAADWLDLKESDQTRLCDEKPWALSMPWDNRTPAEWRVAREQFALNENRSSGSNLSIANGWHFWGPVEGTKLLIESERLHTLLTSIESKGVVRHNHHDGDIRAVVLRRPDGSWRWQVTGGEHRAAVIAALGYASVPARVLQIVNRIDVDIWPGVLSGVFSREAALTAFDLIFDGAAPQIVKPWRESRDRHNANSEALPAS